MNKRDLESLTGARSKESNAKQRPLIPLEEEVEQDGYMDWMFLSKKEWYGQMWTSGREIMHLSV